MTRHWVIAVVIVLVAIVVLGVTYHEWATDPFCHLPDRPLRRSEVETVCRSMLARIARHHRQGVIDADTYRLVYVRHFTSYRGRHDDWALYYFSKQDPETVVNVYWMEESRGVDYVNCDRREFLARYGPKLKAEDREYLLSFNKAGSNK